MKHLPYRMSPTLPGGAPTPRPDSTRCQCHFVTLSYETCPYAALNTNAVSFRGHVIAKACHSDIRKTEAMLAGKSVKFSSDAERKRIKERVTAARVRKIAEEARLKRETLRRNPKPKRSKRKRTSQELARDILAKEEAEEQRAKRPKKPTLLEGGPKFVDRGDGTHDVFHVLVQKKGKPGQLLGPTLPGDYELTRKIAAETRRIQELARQKRAKESNTS